MKILDFHAHLQTHWFRLPLLDETGFVAGLDRCGVEAACIFTLMGFYGNCPGENDQLAAYARRHPTRLIPFATVDPKLGPPAVEELERCLANPIFRGVKFHNWLQSFAPSMARDTLTECLKCAARHGVPTLFHDGTPPYSTTYQIARLARWVPEATVVLGHGGLADYVFPAGQLLRELPNLHVCICGPRAGDIPYLVESAGPDRVMFGSDFGFGSWKVLEERIEDIRHAGLGAAIEEKVFWTNAARLLRWPPSPGP